MNVVVKSQTLLGGGLIRSGSISAGLAVQILACGDLTLGDNGSMVEVSKNC